MICIICFGALILLFWIDAVVVAFACGIENIIDNFNNYVSGFGLKNLNWTITRFLYISTYIYKAQFTFGLNMDFLNAPTYPFLPNI